MNPGETVDPDGTVRDAIGNFVGIDQPAAAKAYSSDDDSAGTPGHNLSVSMQDSPLADPPAWDGKPGTTRQLLREVYTPGGYRDHMTEIEAARRAHEATDRDVDDLVGPDYYGDAT